LDAERVRSLLAECQAMKVAVGTAEILGYACKGYFDRLSDVCSRPGGCGDFAALD
jgi:L-cysteine desulfidase